jgi:hypothetical protein
VSTKTRTMHEQGHLKTEISKKSSNQPPTIMEGRKFIEVFSEVEVGRPLKAESS